MNAEAGFLTNRPEAELNRMQLFGSAFAGEASAPKARTGEGCVEKAQTYNADFAADAASDGVMTFAGHLATHLPHCTQLA